MAFWVVRAGRHGANEVYVLEQNAIVIGWEAVGDLSAISHKEMLQAHVEQSYPNESSGTQRIWTGELWAFKERIQLGDWVAVPITTRSAIAIGRVTGTYRYVPDAPTGAKHQRSVEWIRTDLPRSDVDQDLLFTLGSTLAVFQARRNNAEERLKALAQGQTAKAIAYTQSDAESEDDGAVDLEQFAADQIVKFMAGNLLVTNWRDWLALFCELKGTK